MAAVTPQVQGGVATALLRNIDASVVTRKAKIFFSFASHWFQKLVLVIRTVGIMTLDAIPDGGAVYAPLDLTRIFIRMTLQAELARRYGHQFDTRHVGGYADFMATGTADGDGRMHCLAFGVGGMALQALAVIGLGTQGRVRGREGWYAGAAENNQQRQYHRNADAGDAKSSKRRVSYHRLIPIAPYALCLPGHEHIGRQRRRVRSGPGQVTLLLSCDYYVLSKRHYLPRTRGQRFLRPRPDRPQPEPAARCAMTLELS